MSTDPIDVSEFSFSWEPNPNGPLKWKAYWRGHYIGTVTESNGTKGYYARERSFISGPYFSKEKAAVTLFMRYEASVALTI